MIIYNLYDIKIIIFRKKLILCDNVTVRIINFLYILNIIFIYIERGFYNE